MYYEFNFIKYINNLIILLNNKPKRNYTIENKYNKKNYQKFNLNYTNNKIKPDFLKTYLKYYNRLEYNELFYFLEKLENDKIISKQNKLYIIQHIIYNNINSNVSLKDLILSLKDMYSNINNIEYIKDIIKIILTNLK